jgi:hypothetical protein
LVIRRVDIREERKSCQIKAADVFGFVDYSGMLLLGKSPLETLCCVKVDTDSKSEVERRKLLPRAESSSRQSGRWAERN